MSPRLTDWSLALACALAFVTGVVSLFSGHPEEWLVFAAHGAAGLWLALLLWGKLRRELPRLARPRLWDRRTALGALAVVIVALALGTGIVWVVGGTLYSPLGPAQLAHSARLRAYRVDCLAYAGAGETAAAARHERTAPDAAWRATPWRRDCSLARAAGDRARRGCPRLAPPLHRVARGRELCWERLPCDKLGSRRAAANLSHKLAAADRWRGGSATHLQL